MRFSARKSFIFVTKAHDPKSLGFTLVELLVVITIIAILSVIGVTVFTGVQKNARDTRKKGDVESIIKAYEVRYASTGSYGTTLIEGTAFASGSVPTPPEGGAYDVMLDNTTGGIKVCSTLADGSAFCQGSVQEQAPTGTTNVTYLSGGPGGGGGPAPSSSPTASPTSTPAPVPTPTPVPLGPNLLASGSFDPNINNWSCNWSSACSSDSTSRTGAKSARVTRYKPVTGSYNTWGDALSQVPSSTPAGNYCLSGYVRGGTIGATGNLHIQSTTASIPSDYSVGLNFTIPDTTTWMKVQGVVARGSGWGGSGANVVVQLSGSNTNGQFVLFEDVALQANATTANCPTLP